MPRGTSPLTRGKRTLGGGPGWERGNIPAHAGKTVARSQESTLPAEHPRSRGENCHQPAKRCSVRGTSPLTRGKRFQAREVTLPVGNIPAHAGKTVAAPESASPCKEHPRSRGENESCVSLASRLGGTSPLTRGKLINWQKTVPKIGNIPAHAGKTPCLVYATS